MGERELAPVKAKKAIAAACQEAMDAKVERAAEAMRVQTPGGVFSVRWVSTSTDLDGPTPAIDRVA